MTLDDDGLVERRVELITNALLHLPVRGAELQFAARQVELALRPEMDEAADAITRWAMEKLTGSVTLLPVVRADGGWVKYADHQAALIQAEARGAERQWQPIETAPKDGRMLLLYNVAHDSQDVMGWSVGFDDEDFPDGCWTDAGNQNKAINTLANGNYFQFWQPLPTPPVIRNLETKDAG